MSATVSQSVSVVDVMMATAWRPNPGDTLTGAVVHRELRTTEHGTYPVVYFAVDGIDGLIAVHAFHTTLKDGFKELAPTRGEFVSITYAGMKESNKRTDSKGEPVEYHHYAVYRPDETIESGDMGWDDVPF